MANNGLCLLLSLSLSQTDTQNKQEKRQADGVYGDNKNEAMVGVYVGSCIECTCGDCGRSYHLWSV